METFKNKEGKPILLAMVKAIQENKVYLSEIDGLIGDGDHGMNMNKGFSVFGERFKDQKISFSQGLGELGTILLTEIGGSMGPIYGTLFLEMGSAIVGLEDIDLKAFASMLGAGIAGLSEIIESQPGDKTLIDTLAPAINVLKQSVKAHTAFDVALDEMKQAALDGKESTTDMIARFGRSSRLGERSRGVPDAGATSCYILLATMADAIVPLLIKENAVY